MNALEKYASKRKLAAQLHYRLKTAGLLGDIWGGIKNIFTGSPAANAKRKAQKNLPTHATIPAETRVQRGINQFGGMPYKSITKR